MKERVTLTIERDLLHRIDSKVDGLSVKNRSHAVELFLRRALKGQVPQRAIILAGGANGRGANGAKTTPKPLLKVQGKPLLEHNIDLLKRFDILDIIISVGHGKERIKEYFGDGAAFGIRITYLDEDPDHPLGTAGPLRGARGLLGQDPFVVMNADELKDVNIEQVYRTHIQSGGLATITLTTVKDPTKFGVAMLDGNRILRFVEKPNEKMAPSKLISAGLYILEPQVLDLIPDGFAMLETDLFPKLARDGVLFGHPFAGKWYSPESPQWIIRIEKEWEGFKA